MPEDSALQHASTADSSFEWTEEGDSSGTPDQLKHLDYLFSLTYEELRRLAATVRRGDPSLTLNTTALVNEAWLKLASSPQFRSTSQLHFKRIAARAMRQLLIEAARRRLAGKRDAGGPVASLGHGDEPVAKEAKELLALDLALQGLRQASPRQALLVEARFFGGFEMAELAEFLNVSESTLLRDWRAARAWLMQELRKST